MNENKSIKQTKQLSYRLESFYFFMFVCLGMLLIAIEQIQPFISEKSF